MLSQELIEILACPRCKGNLALERGGKGLSCSSCSLTYPVRKGVPVLIPEEADGLEKGSGAVDFGDYPPRRLLVLEGSNRGEMIEVEYGTCRAIGRSLDDSQKTRAFSVESAVSLDDFSKKLVMNYIARQYKKAERAGEAKEGGAETLGVFRRKKDIYLSDNAISRLHAMVFYGDSGVGILDLVSKNGTFVGGVEIESQLLKKGDIVSIGSTKIRLEE
ncbi:MAG: FHA domain-containing protein [Deltaproteobacteria bacterium]|nr:FHA domain-containing protein [Deltaproteobacteria bacterium]MBI4374243.1 FHA domain-containing protein [Deltaproteobacteria bacterium]